MENPFKIIDSKLSTIEGLLHELKNEKSNYAPNDSNSCEIINIQQASELLNLALSTIYSLTSKRILPFSKRGKKLYFKKSELLHWIDSGRRNSLSDLKGKATTYINHSSNF